MGEHSARPERGACEVNVAAKTVCRTQLARMLRMIVELRTRRFPDAHHLAQAGEVSRRTLYRDIAALVDAGVPILYRADQRGYELAPGFFLPPVALEESEAIALAIHALGESPTGGPDVSSEARSGLLKIVSILPDGPRSRISELIAHFERFPTRTGASGRWDVDSRDVMIRIGLAVNERAHSSVG